MWSGPAAPQTYSKGVQMQVTSANWCTPVRLPSEHLWQGSDSGRFHTGGNLPWTLQSVQLQTVDSPCHNISLRLPADSVILQNDGVSEYPDVMTKA